MKVVIKLIIAVVLLIIFTTMCQAQRVYVTDIKSQADKIVFVTTAEYDADWKIYITEYRNEAKDGKWYFTKYASDADYKIYFTSRRYEADVEVFYTQYTNNIKY